MAEYRRQGGMNALVAGVIGAAVGASLVALGKKETRKKIKATLNENIQKGDELLDRAGEKVAEARDKGRKRLVEELDKTKNRLEETDIGQDKPVAM